TRDRVPRHWATTQMNLGNALVTLGERESGTARLEEAVTAYLAALEQLTRDRAPLNWAAAQMNLGTALLRLGERESGTARLEEAVTAYRAALGEWTRDRVPLKWAMIQTNLCGALRVLGERESGTMRLEESVAACRAALGERTRDRVPLDWAKTQSISATRLCDLESGRAASRGWRRRSPPTVRRWRNRCAIGRRSTGRRLRLTSATGSGGWGSGRAGRRRSEEHTSELQSRSDLVCRLLLEKKKQQTLDL